MMHLTTVYEGEGFTFELVLGEYNKFTRRRCSVQGFERPVVLKEFEHLKVREGGWGYRVTSYDNKFDFSFPPGDTL